MTATPKPQPGYETARLELPDGTTFQLTDLRLITNPEAQYRMGPDGPVKIGGSDAARITAIIGALIDTTVLPRPDEVRLSRMAETQNAMARQITSLKAIAAEAVDKAGKQMEAYLELHAMALLLVTLEDKMASAKADEAPAIYRELLGYVARLRALLDAPMAGGTNHG